MKVSRDSGNEARKDWTGKMMELNCYDDNDNPAYGYDSETYPSLNTYGLLMSLVFVQRIVRLPMRESPSSYSIFCPNRKTV